MHNKILLGALALFITACTAEIKDTPRSIDDVSYRGPNALCPEIEDVLDYPPSDMTEWQTRVAQLSENACRLPSDDLTVEIAQAALGNDSFAYEIESNRLTVYARSDQDEQRLCCSLQSSLLPVARTPQGNIFAGRYRLESLHEARLDFRRPGFKGKPILYRGENAQVDLYLETGELQGAHSEGTLYSAVLDETRAYQLYTPPGHTPGDDVGLVVMGDGISLGYYIRQWEPMVLDGRMAPFIAIGVLSGKRAVIDPQRDYDFNIRNSDYIINYKDGPQRFKPHLQFVTDELMPKIAAELGYQLSAEKTALVGGSSGGSFALWGVMTRPDIFGHAVGTSPSGPVELDLSDLAAERYYYIDAGLYEPNFHANAQFYAEAIQEAGANVDLRIYADGHSADHRALYMAYALPKIFPAK